MRADEGFVPLLHSKSEAARILGIGERTIQALITTGKLSVVRLGRRVLVPRSELLRLSERK